MAGIPVVIRGLLFRAGLHVGGGPIIPPDGERPPSDAHPEHPIVLPPESGEPPTIWPPGPGIDYPSHPIVIPPGFIDGVHPEHPIVIPAPPRPTHPIVYPPEIQHPIVLPPELPIWGDAHPEHPIVLPPPSPPVTIWPPGPGIDMPTHPIVIPPEPPVDGQPPGQIMENWEVKAAWTVDNGWMTVLVPSESHPGVPTPSRRG